MTARTVLGLALAAALAGCRAGAPDEGPVTVVPTLPARPTDAPRAAPDRAGSAAEAPPDTSAGPSAGPAPKAGPDAAAASAVGAPATAAPTGGIYVLIVGIDDYPGADDDLASTHADVALVREAVAERFRVPASHVKTLLDGAATRAAVVDGFRRHLAQAGPDGTAVFYFSGHGLRLDGNAGWADDERDGRDEALYMWGPGGAGAVLLDDELGLLADDLGAGRTVLVLDACFSGTGARGRVRPKVVDAADAVLGAPPEWLTTGRTPPAEDRTATVAAASDTEEALAGEPGQPSLFTSVFAPALRGAPDNASLADVVRAVRPRVLRLARGYGYVQTPQAEGRADVALHDFVP